MQQPIDSEKPWYKKGSMLMLIISSMILIGSIVSLYNQTDELSEILDPRVNNIAEIHSGESVDVKLSKNTHYAAYSLNNADVSSKNLHLIDKNSQLEIDSTEGLMFSDRQSADGEVLPALKWWVLDEDTNASIVNEGNATIWLIDYASAENEMMSRGEIMLSMAGCMVSICLIPFSIILLMMSRKKNNSQSVMYTNNSDINSYQNVISNNNMSATTNINNQNMNILSTDRIFALTHGDEKMKDEVMNSIPKNDGFTIKDNEEEVPPPFADTKPPEFVKSKNIRIKNDNQDNNTHESENTNWKDWDEG